MHIKTMYIENLKKCITKFLKNVYQNFKKMYILCCECIKYMIKKPKLMCVIVGYTDVIAKDPETGIYIVPITALRA